MKLNFNLTMPKLQKLFSLEVTPQQFLDNCSDQEIQETGY